MEKLELRIWWWNTGLCPPIRKKIPPDDAAILKARDLVARLFNSAHLIALGEISAEALELLRSKLQEPAIHSVPSTERNLALLFDSRVVEVRSVSHLKEAIDKNSTVHAAWECHIDVKRTATTLRLLTVHWPSPRSDGDAERREYAAGAVWRRAAEGTEASAGTIVLGDFNEEPFEKAICVNLQSSRERRAVVDGGAHFYSPFWRLQGEPETMESVSVDRGPGTIKLSTDNKRHRTRWRLIDFALVDKPLVTGEAGWQLMERETRIEEMGSSDHAPIGISLVATNRDSR